MTENKPAFWTSLPGILTGLAAIITASVGLYLAIIRDSKPPDQSASTAQSPIKPSVPPYEKWSIWKEETFKDNSRGWNVGNLKIGGFKRVELELVDGKYRWDLETLGDRSFWWEAPFGSLDDFYVSSSLRFLDPTLVRTYAGIVFGSSAGTSYYFVISPRQQFALWKFAEGGAKSTVILAWTPVQIDLHSSIHLGIQVDNRQLSLFVNSERVGSVTESSFTGGKMGLFAGSEEAAAFVVDFDDFTIRQKPSH